LIRTPETRFLNVRLLHRAFTGATAIVRLAVGDNTEGKAVTWPGVVNAVHEYACRMPVAAADKDTYVNFIVGSREVNRNDLWVEGLSDEISDKIVLRTVSDFSIFEYRLVGR
jgi:hypothetical protein